MISNLDLELLIDCLNYNEGSVEDSLEYFNR